MISNIESLRSNATSYSTGASLTMEILFHRREMVEIMEARAYAELSQSREMQARPILAAIEAIASHCADVRIQKTADPFSEGFSPVRRWLWKGGSPMLSTSRTNPTPLSMLLMVAALLRDRNPFPKGSFTEISARSLRRYGRGPDVGI